MRGGRFRGSLDAPAAYYYREFLQALEEGGKLRERKGVGTVGKRFGGVVVGFQEDAVDACGYSGAGERLDEFWLSATGVALAARELDGMSDVKDYRIAKSLKNWE